MGKAVRAGVLGLRRGGALARLAQQAGMQVVAVCERDDQRRQAAKALGTAAYRDVEPFLDHDMDAVVLVNDFDQHAPVAVAALERGLSVVSETAACRSSTGRPCRNSTLSSQKSPWASCRGSWTTSAASSCATRSARRSAASARAASVALGPQPRIRAVPLGGPGLDVGRL